MQETDEIQDLWTLLDDEASQEKMPDPPKVEGIPQTPTFLDRLAQRFASGVLPLFLLGLAPLLPFSLIGGLFGILSGLALLFPICWLLAPLAQRRGYCSFANLLLLLLPVVIYATAVAIVPTQLSEVHIHRLAAFYQLALESVLSLGGLAFCAALLGILGGVSFKLSKHHPWTRTQPASTIRIVAAWTIALAPFLGYGAMWAVSAPSGAELAFRAKYEAPTHESTDRYEDIYTNYNLTTDKTPEFLRDLAERLIASSRIGLPRYQRDGQLVVFLTKNLIKSAASELSREQRQELAYLSLYSHTLARPLEGARRARDSFREDLIPALLESP